jgi:SpoIID/LytB domain protein
VSTVNFVTLDRYTAGVIPQEMPTSWQRAAVDAQAVAARTYGQYAVEHPLSTDYDICDTTQCQVYGGHAVYDAHGVLQSTDFQAAATDTAGKVLTYRGATIFAEFSASNGGWSVDGGQPYLKAAADPYDTTASGDPYLNYTKVVHVTSIARHYGLKTVTKIAITQRDGHGTWGGRTLAGVITGTDSANKAKSVPTTGFELQAAFGVGTTWFELLANN